MWKKVCRRVVSPHHSVGMLALVPLLWSSAFVMQPLSHHASVAIATSTAVVRMADEDDPLKVKGSSLTLTPEQVAERNEKRNLVNRLLPLTVVGAFALNFATGGALENIEIKSPVAGPKGLDEARALKARSAAKSKEKYQQMLQRDLAGGE